MVRVIVDECVALTREVMAQIEHALGQPPDELIEVCANRPGVPDIVILERWLDARTLLVTKDRALHNQALGRGFRSLVFTPETGWTERRLAHVNVADRLLPVPKSDGEMVPPTNDMRQIADTLKHYWTERQVAQFRTKRRRIRSHFGAADNMGQIALTVGQRRFGPRVIGGYRLKIDARHGIKALNPANEGYFETARDTADPLAATLWALAQCCSLHLAELPVVLFHLDAEALCKCRTLIDGAAATPVDRAVARLFGTYRSVTLEPCTKGFHFDQFSRKLVQVSQGGNEVIEIVPTMIAGAVNNSDGN